MVKIFTNIYFLLRVAKTNPKRERFEKPKKKHLLLLIPKNIGDRVLSECKTIKYQLNIEKKVQGVS